MANGCERSPGRSAWIIGAGILVSRIAGLIRDRVFAHYFGNSAAADAFKAAFRIPNLLQNLFGEGVLSASFIPVYAGLLARKLDEDASRVAGAVATLLAFTVAVIVLGGVLLTPALVGLIAPGFAGEKRALTIRLVQVLFPAAGVLVLSAWCLGILNSHRRFFLSYAAPVVWNVAMIATLLGFGGWWGQPPLAEALAWGAVVGSILQLGIQLPAVLRLLKRLRLSLRWGLQDVRIVVRNFIPVCIGRGVVQLSAYVDMLLASFLPTGAVAALSYAQTLYLLPLSLFGMSVSAAELPAMASALGSEREVAGALRRRLDAGLRQIAFWIIPSVVAFLALGDVIIAAVYQSGRFTPADVVYVWGVLAGSTLGLLASALGRLYASAYYALRDTRTPLCYALAHVSLASVLGYLFAIPLPAVLGLERRWGVAGLTVAAGMAGWVEFALLRRTLNRRIGPTGLPTAVVLQLWAAATLGAAAAWGIKVALGPRHPILLAPLVLSPYGLLYVALTWCWRVPEALALLRRVTRILGRGGQ